ncbi:chemotaxis protein CheA [Sphingomonas sp. AP4-R1]|uniref:chemotaxis protein CheA n=1 Tax=Sphingomonas sp. AP4-R1 TaxID=2735134 RepID=UPI001493798E|nr:chemotaxis protein CheA [Sphingomonas sp. AP4-R1]QJU57459.1 chemotaxis protein CheA [Sphingomonas sp. AP4-R1]
MPVSGADDELDAIRAIFFEECTEGLQAAEEGLTAINEGEHSPDIVASVFRAVHSIKGGSGAFGFSALLGFSHRFENVLDEMRSNRILPRPDVMQVMLTAFDVLFDHVAAARDGSTPPNDEAASHALDALLVADAPAAAPVAAPPPVAAQAAPEPEADEMGFVPVVIDLDFFGDGPVADAPAVEQVAPWLVHFAPSATALAHGGEPLLLIRELEEKGATIEEVDLSTLPALRDFDPEECYFGWTLRVPGTVPEADILDCFDFVTAHSKVDVHRDPAGMTAPAAAPPASAPAAVAEQPVPAAPVAAVAAALPPLPAAAPAPAAAQSGQTVRVELSKLDELLNFIGELVIHGSILSDRLQPADQERIELPELSRLTRQIQDSVMSLRAQPIRHVFSRIPRMLRDLMSETGKQVVLETSGEMTEVDKGVLEKIGDPLTHMIRNAVDHGIESPEERIAAGKPPVGRILVEAEQKGTRILVKVIDDGRGIDRARVRAKAIERGIIGPDAVLSEEEIDGLICTPGFSTANSISSISGRGVGMDVVRSNVTALGGRLEIHSVPGKGTEMCVALPVTLAILDGMIVKLRGQRFVLPLTNVVETIKPEPGQVTALTGGSEVIFLRGSYIPVKRISDILGLKGGEPDEADRSLVIIVESDDFGHVGLMIDSIENRREVVIKSLEENLHPIRGLGGATVLGDGSIALILDIDALIGQPKGQAKSAYRGLAA